jgi:hypothetical protein
MNIVRAFSSTAVPFSILLSLLFLPLPGSAAARTPFQARCEDDLGKTVSLLMARQSGYSLNHDRSYKVLTQMKPPGRANAMVLGLTKTESRIEIKLAGAILQDPPSGYECVAPQITVRLFYDPVVIYVGREFPAGSCSYAQILAHELRHMKVYLDHLPVVEKAVRAALANRFEGRPLYAPSGTARSALEHEINSGWLPYIRAEMAKVELQQAQIDSAQEYARLGASCNGEINTILGPLQVGGKHRNPR